MHIYLDISKLFFLQRSAKKQNILKRLFMESKYWNPKYKSLLRCLSLNVTQLLKEKACFICHPKYKPKGVRNTEYLLVIASNLLRVVHL